MTTILSTCRPGRSQRRPVVPSRSSASLPSSIREATYLAAATQTGSRSDGSLKSAVSTAMHCGAAGSAAPTRTPIRTSCVWWLAMTDAAAILASLDRFIGQLARQAELTSSHRVATQISPMATTNPLTKQVTNHSYHSGHPKPDTFVGADHERCDSPPCPGEDSSAGLARKVSSMGGYSGKSGKSPQNQALTGGHRKNASGKSGNCYSDQRVAGNLIGPRSRSGQE